MSFTFQEDINRHFTHKKDMVNYLGCQERCMSCLVIISSFCVVLCGELVNVRLRNISNSTKPLEKRYTGTLRALRPHIFVLTLMEPTFYLGVKIKKTVMPNGVVAWDMSSSKYIQSAVQNVQEYLKKNGNRKLKLKKKAYATSEATYRAEIGESLVLGLEKANFFQSQIWILRWCMELGRIDIITEVSILSIFLCMPLMSFIWEDRR
jgi:hypothetical protein